MSKNNETHLALNIPETVTGDEQIQEYLLKEYHIDVDLSEEWYSHLFYNADLRSHMGFIWEFGDPLELVLWPKYYKELYPELYQKLLDNSDEVELQ